MSVVSFTDILNDLRNANSSKVSHGKPDVLYQKDCHRQKYQETYIESGVFLRIRISACFLLQGIFELRFFVRGTDNEAELSPLRAYVITE